MAKKLTQAEILGPPDLMVFVTDTDFIPVLNITANTACTIAPYSARE